MRRPLLIASSLVALAATACPSAPAPAPEPGPPGPADGTRLETTSTGHNVDGLVMIAPGERLMLPVSLPYQGERVRIDHISVIWHVGTIEADIDRPVTVSLIADSGNNLPVGAFLGERVDVVPAGSAMHALNGLVVSDHALGFDSAPHFWLGLEVPLGAPDALALSVDKSAGKALVMRHDGTIARYDSLPLVDIAWRPTSSSAPAPAPRRDFAGLSGGDSWWGFHSDMNDDWSYGNDSGEAPDQQLGAPGKGQGFLRVDLPPGAHGARLTAFDAVYATDVDDRAAGAGRVRWTLVADRDGKPTDEVLGHVDVDVMAAMTTPLDEPVTWLRHPIGVELPARAWLRFETLSGAPKVAATHAPELAGGDADSRVYFRAAPDAPLQAVATRAYLKLHFDNVGR